MASPYPVIGLGGTVVYSGIANDTVQSKSGVLAGGGSFRAAVTDSAAGGGLPGATVVATFRRTATLGGTYVVRNFGTIGLVVAPFDTALTGTTNAPGEITFSVRASGALEVENRSGVTIDMGVVFEIQSA